MDRDSRTIVVSFFAVLGFAVTALSASLVVPFDVNHSATVQRFSGDVELDSHHNIPDRLDPARNQKPSLKPDQTLRVLPGGAATLRFEINNARAIMTGPAELTIVASYRRAMLLGHILDSDRFSRDHVLTLAQSSGTVEYRFANTDPPFEDVQITIQLPESEYTPVAPCWTISISAEGTAQTETIDCTG